MRIGFSYWGFCEDWRTSQVIQTPDGGRVTRPLLVQELLRREHEVIALQDRREVKPIPGLQFADGAFPDLDAILMEWRWKTWKNDANHPNFVKEKYEPDVGRQGMLLHHYGGDVPIVIYDTDLKITSDMEKKLKDLCKGRVLIVDPCVKPRRSHERQLYWTDNDIWLEPLFSRPSQPMYLYIGSNYERRILFQRYYVKVARNWSGHVRVHGNWLTPSPERPDQEKLVGEWSEVIDFRHRNQMFQAAYLYSRSLAATHVLKNIYNSIGLMTPRFHEASLFGCIGLVPREVSFHKIFPDIFVVASAEDVVDRLRLFECFPTELRLEYVILQREVIRQTYPETIASVAAEHFLKLFQEV